MNGDPEQQGKRRVLGGGTKDVVITIVAAWQSPLGARPHAALASESPTFFSAAACRLPTSATENFSIASLNSR